MTDWTSGTPVLCFDQCDGCGGRWSLPRAACPHCGTTGPTRRASVGTGTVAAVTVVHRAPSGGHHPPTPFTLVLVDLDEGVRVMGRAVAGRVIGERVIARFDDGVPSFDAEPTAATEAG